MEILNASNECPIVITTDEIHCVPLAPGTKFVTLDDILGNTAANGTWLATYIDNYNFYLEGSVGNGDFISSPDAELTCGLWIPDGPVERNPESTLTFTQTAVPIGYLYATNALALSQTLSEFLIELGDAATSFLVSQAVSRQFIALRQVEQSLAFVSVIGLNYTRNLTPSNTFIIISEGVSAGIHLLPAVTPLTMTSDVARILTSNQQSIGALAISQIATNMVVRQGVSSNTLTLVQVASTLQVSNKSVSATLTISQTATCVRIRRGIASNTLTMSAVALDGFTSSHGTVTFNTSGTWVAVATSVTFEGWGAGGNGSAGSVLTGAGGGGGGNVKATVTGLTLGVSYTVNVATNASTTTWFISAPTIGATSGANASGNTGGAGGSGFGSPISYPGLASHTGGNGGNSLSSHGGGGGSAGDTGNGGNGAAGPGGSPGAGGVAGTTDGAAGADGTASATGLNGNTPGGGGGGALTTGGIGAPGRVILTW